MNRERKEKEMQEKSEKVIFKCFLFEIILPKKIDVFLFSEKATDSVQYFLRNNTQYKYESDLNDLGKEFPSHIGHYIIMMSLCITSS